MNKKISATAGRLALAGLVLGAFILSLLVLYFVGRGGAISGETSKVVIQDLLDIYLPLIAVMAAFYFSQGTASVSENRTSLEVFIFGVVVVGIWVVMPPLFIAFGVIEDVLATITIFKPYGSSVAVAGVAYYFAKSSEAPANENA